MTHYSLNADRFLRVAEHLAHGVKKTLRNGTGITAVFSGMRDGCNAPIYNLGFRHHTPEAQDGKVRQHFEVSFRALLTVPDKVYASAMKSVEQPRNVRIARIDTAFQIDSYEFEAQLIGDNTTFYVTASATFQLNAGAPDITEQLDKIIADANSTEPENG